MEEEKLFSVIYIYLKKERLLFNDTPEKMEFVFRVTHFILLNDIQLHTHNDMFSVLDVSTM